MSHGFDKYELPTRLGLVLSHYIGRRYETSDDVLADRRHLVELLDNELAKPRNRTRIAMQELRRDLVAGHPRGSITREILASIHK
jgi:hypothetical protein